MSLHNHHLKRSERFAWYVKSEFGISSQFGSIQEVPFLPARAFKHFELKSIRDEEIYKVLTSSGTSGLPSRIFLDKETALAQTLSLVSTMKPLFGKLRRPFVVATPPGTAKRNLSAATAAVNGFTMFASKVFHLPLEPTSIDIAKLVEFLSETNQGPALFGFTANIWGLMSGRQLRGLFSSFDDSVLLHGGGWKKMEHLRVSHQEFNNAAMKELGIQRVASYYGMVEQTGSLFVECAAGFLHEPSENAFLIRDVKTLNCLDPGHRGYIQVLSTIQKSYPGHSILTEDIGAEIEGICPCGDLKRRLVVIGRAPKTEIRGCSDAT
ncbi:hypothetical protein N9N06_04160 [Aquiluna sp.]|nr:hypothetical protein [Aquiluna sp.]